MIELVNLEGDEWIPYAQSERVDYLELVANGSISVFGDNGKPTFILMTPWSGGDFTPIPEPNAALLMMLGGSALALRRKQMRA